MQVNCQELSVPESIFFTFFYMSIEKANAVGTAKRQLSVKRCPFPLLLRIAFSENRIKHPGICLLSEPLKMPLTGVFYGTAVEFFPNHFAGKTKFHIGRPVFSPASSHLSRKKSSHAPGSRITDE